MLAKNDTLDTEKSRTFGGSFLLDKSGDDLDGFVPEMFTADDRFMAKSIEDFVRTELPGFQAGLKAHERGLMPGLLKKAGALGLLGAGVPESFGGLDLSKTVITLLGEKTAINPPFAISSGVHSGVATLPILYFGTEEQRSKWLPGLATGEIIGAFALTEAESGSDALSARTKAVISESGDEYILNGSKMWITERRIRKPVHRVCGP